MSSLKTTAQHLLDRHWQGKLSDYVTAIAWSPNGKTLAASSAAGEVMLWRDWPSKGKANWPLIPLQIGDHQSVDCLAFSRGGQLLAAGGQNGRVQIWHLPLEEVGAYRCRPSYTLDNAPAWIEHLAWSSTRNQLAFSSGRDVQVWDADTGNIDATLNFDTSSVISLGWRCDGQHLAVGGYQGVKVWNSQNWNDDPYVLEIPSASLAIAWSPDGKYLASGNLDRTLTVLEWHNPHPWVMQGFPGKIRQLAWSEATTQAGTSLLAASSVEAIVAWEKHIDESVGWQGRILTRHEGIVQAIAFHPGSFLLASAAEDGWVCLWPQAKRLGQILEGAPDGFSALAWHPQGHQLAAGGQNGELLIWSKSKRAQGFRQR